MPKKAPPRKDHNKVPRAPREIAPLEPREAERVAKVVARAGLGSRREVEEWIAAGRVAVNGEVLESPARTVTRDDLIEVDGTPIPAKERTRLFLYHKPKGVVTTNFDPEGRATLFEILPPGLPRLVSVGRLDLNTEGLILLTNDGGLSRVLELPETGWLRRYRVRAKGDITQDKLDALIKGVTVDGVHYGPIEAALDRVQGANVWLTLALREGKNREVRNVLGSLGLDVNRLIRLSYGPFQLGEIAQGAVEEVRTRVLADQLGPELSAAAGADFEGPVFSYDEPDEDKAARAGKPGTKPAAKGPRYAKPEGGEDRHRRRPIDLEETAERSVTSGLVADRKGRKVLVQRVRSTEVVAEERPARPLRERERREEEQEAKRARPERAPRKGGESTFRKRPDGERPPRRERPEGDRPERPFRERTPRPEGERSERPFRSRPEGERGFRPRAEGVRAPRRERPEGDRPERPFRERTPRPEGERSFRPRGDGERAPRRERPEGDRPERPFRERTPRPDGERSERPFRERAPRPEGGRSFRGESGDRPYSGRVKSEGAFRERPMGGKTGSRPPRDDEGSERPRGAGRPAGKSFGAKNFGGKSFGGKSFGGKPGASRPGGKPAGGKPSSGKPGGRPSGGKPSGKRPPRG